MFCLKPVDCWKCGDCIAQDGIKSPKLVFSYSKALDYYLRIADNYIGAVQLVEKNRLNLECGKCSACMIRKRKDMSVRLCNEISCHDDCCFITLTYDNEHIPLLTYDNELVRGDNVGQFSNYTLFPADVQKFIKRLRRHLEYRPKHKKDVRDFVDKPIRYFAVGEYGSKTLRPHYHIIIFGWKPSDQYVYQVRDGYTINRSSQIEKLWKFGFSTVADVNTGVAKYCARYVTKKLVNSDKKIDPFSIPEFTLQSTRNGGIGALWLEKYYKNLKHGFINIWNGDKILKCSIPRYYYARLRKTFPNFWLELRNERLDFCINNRSRTDFDEVCRKVEIERLNLLHSLKKEQL